MRVHAALLLVLILFAASPALAAQTQGPPQAGQWSRMPSEAKTSYMTGAAAGARAFSEVHPDAPKPARIRVDQAVTNMDHLAADPMYRRQPLMVVALKALLAAQDTGTSVVEFGPDIRDPQFDSMVLFDYPWLAPINLEAYVPRTIQGGAKPTFAHSWLAADQNQKQLFAQGFGDMVAAQCMERYGDTPKGNSCLKPLLPLPMDMVLMEMDGIYRDSRFENLGYDLVIRAALAKMTGDDWQSVLAGK